MQVHRNAAMKNTRPRKPRPAPITYTQVNRGVWAKAMELAHGDPQRIRIISATKVEVV